MTLMLGITETFSSFSLHFGILYTFSERIIENTGSTFKTSAISNLLLFEVIMSMMSWYPLRYASCVSAHILKSLKNYLYSVQKIEGYYYNFSVYLSTRFFPILVYDKKSMSKIYKITALIKRKPANTRNIWIEMATAIFGSIAATNMAVSLTATLLIRFFLMIVNNTFQMWALII